MQFLGLTISRTKGQALQAVDGPRAWARIIGESFTGAWQRNVEIRLDDVLTHPTVFACITLIASDIAKMCLRLKKENDGGIWEDAEVPSYSPVLRKPNQYQTIIKFIEQWIFSKLIWGNTYVLKQYDNRGVVISVHVLDPARVRVLISDSGAVYYDLQRDSLAGQGGDHIVVPARYIMHDVMYSFYHPLCGLPPLHASGLLATLGLKIITNSANAFANGSTPSGLLMAVQGITSDKALELQHSWEENFSGDNYGRVAVLGADLKYQPLAVPANKMQLAEQWGKTSEAIATTFHVPFHLVGGPPPPYNNIQALTVQYFTQCLQSLCRQLETVLDEGLGLGRQFQNRYGTEFDIDDLLWMDSLTMMSVIKDGVSAGVFSPNDGRKMRNLPPTEGGHTPYLQQQNYSLSALNKRDTSDDPFKTATPAPAPKTDEPTLEPTPDPDKSFDPVGFKVMVQRKRMELAGATL